jgi:hypothetical protein
MYHKVQGHGGETSEHARTGGVLATRSSAATKIAIPSVPQPADCCWLVYSRKKGETNSRFGPSPSRSRSGAFHFAGRWKVVNRPHCYKGGSRYTVATRPGSGFPFASP